MISADIVVGGQFGDEGKGQVALWMGDHGRYAALLRTGGENAEHRVTTQDGRQEVFHILPSATASYSEAPILLPAGMTFSLDGLRRELGRGNLADRGDIVVDQNAAIITDELRESGREAANGRGSTFLGVGATMAEKVRRAGNCQTARDHAEELEGMGVRVGNVVRYMRAMERKAPGEPVPILIEGSQGTMLSLDHGYYPWCTSRNVTSSGVIDGCGLAWQNVARVIMVVKALPTRVPGNSGPSFGRELTWERACERAGRPYEEILQTADASAGAGPGAGGVERPFELSFEELEYAASLNRPTSVVLTFLDWWNYGDLGVRTYSKLSAESRRLIADVEEACEAPVFMVRTGPKYWDLIFRAT